MIGKTLRIEVQLNQAKNVLTSHLSGLNGSNSYEISAADLFYTV